nr:MAG TPA: hypothetical protein [Caudoviricetes sp.]
MIYAQINEDKICVGISNLSENKKSEDMILLDRFDISLLGKKWNGTSWEDVGEPEPPEPQESNTEKILKMVEKSQDEVRQEGADIVMEELMKRGLIV